MQRLKRCARQGVQWLLARGGYELRRLPSLVAGGGGRSLGDGRVVEFLGPTGIGKSTLFGQLRIPSREWMSRAEVEIAANLRYEVLALPGMAPRIYEQLLFAKFREIQALQLDSATKASQARYALNKLLYDAAYRTHRPSRGLVSDDGICHNFAAQLAHCGRQAQDDGEMRQFLAGRALVRLVASPERILAQLRQRHRDTPGVGNDWLGHLGEEGARALVDQSLQHTEAICELFDCYERPILYLDDAAAPHDNQRRILCFLKGLTGEAPSGVTPPDRLRPGP